FCVLCFTSCDLTSVDPLTKPFALETYQGPMEVEFAIAKTYPKALTTVIVNVYSDSKGKTATIYGLPPGTPYFEIIPQKAFDALANDPPLKNIVTKVKGEIITPPPMVSGLRVRNIDGEIAEITGFASPSTLAVEMDFEVTGSFVLDGKMFSTLEDDPIIIWARVGNLKRTFPEYFLEDIVNLTDGKSVPEMDDNERVALYRIFFAGQSMTFAY
ncbi:MAG: hypothetical protein KDD48_05525, partial [Bdellovibrionales bacterium]|nr:hypothetical protein [Bdellovibrionales bacterium]